MRTVAADKRCMVRLTWTSRKAGWVMKVDRCSRSLIRGCQGRPNRRRFVMTMNSIKTYASVPMWLALDRFLCQKGLNIFVCNPLSHKYFSISKLALKALWFPCWPLHHQAPLSCGLVKAAPIVITHHSSTLFVVTSRSRQCWILLVVTPHSCCHAFTFAHIIYRHCILLSGLHVHPHHFLTLHFITPHSCCHAFTFVHIILRHYVVAPRFCCQAFRFVHIISRHCIP